MILEIITVGGSDNSAVGVDDANSGTDFDEPVKGTKPILLVSYLWML